MEADRRHVIPGRPGLLVANPERGDTHLPAEGLVVTWSTYWERRLADGDVTLAPAPQSKDTTRHARAVKE